ncbi:MAG: phosphoadenylyl-sulfate reductase [Cyanobium sp.]|nr:phosphoadenylyl-sulfate reductase [Cyanobium sp.]
MATAQATTLPPDRSGLPVDPEQACAQLQTLDPAARLRWGLETFGDGFAITTSFGIQSAVLLHQASRLMVERALSIPVIWVDTGYLPPETYRYADQLCGLLGIVPQVAQAELSPARMEALHGRLWETGRVEDLELYHRLRKVDPLDQALRRLQVRCWASGVRGSQTDHRSSMAVLDGVRRRWSLRPLLSWTNRDVYYYMQEYDLPQHPLFDQGYSTVGDWHSSAPDDGSIKGRATRFSGLKQECGIHLPGLMGEGI